MSKKKTEERIDIVEEVSKAIVYKAPREIAAPQRLGVNTVKETVPVTLTSETVKTTD